MAAKSDLPQGDGTKPLQIAPTSEGYSLREGARPLPLGISSEIGLISTVFIYILFSPFFILFSPFVLLLWIFKTLGFFSKLSTQALTRKPNISADRHTGYISLFFIAFAVLWTVLVLTLPTVPALSWPPIAHLIQILLWTRYLFIVYIIFGAVYGGIKLVFDPEMRKGLGFQWSLDKLEILFSHYPLKVGENDRLQLRRRLKETVGTQLCNLRAFPEDSWATVTLLCVEEVKYTKGTDTFTEQAEVYAQVVYSHSLPGGESRVNGYFDLEIPPNLGASFEGKNNQIRWLLKIEERYGNWLHSKVTYLPFWVDV